MDIFVARQPILSRSEDIIGYELLYRNSQDNVFSEIDGDVATIELLLNSFVSIGNEKLSDGKKLFINFTRNLLLKRVPCLFSPEKIVIEVLENVTGDQEMIDIILEFKQLGYTIALDDFTPYALTKGLVPHADIIKVDFLQSTSIQRKAIQNIAKSFQIKLLAEKVETREDYTLALKEGYDYYQGYFFSKPVIITSREVPLYSNDYLQILTELNDPECSINKIARLIECDLSLSYRLLKIVNTMAYYTRVKVTSIKQAILILGLNELVKILTIISLREQQVKTSISKEILLRSVVRASFAEQIGASLYGRDKSSECFLLGMFSLLDTILQQPMEIVLEPLPLSDDLKKALLGSNSKYNDLLRIVTAGEKGDWDTLQKLAPTIASINLSTCYENAIKWASDINFHLDDTEIN